MPPKANKGGKKKGGDDDDFDALLAQAVAAAGPAADAKKQKKPAAAPAAAAPAADGAAAAGTAEEAPQPVSRADHPENPYPQVAQGKKRQTWPEPTVPVCEQFAPDAYPVGEVVPHALPEINAFRESSEEKRALERAGAAELAELRHAAEVHRQVRRWVHSWVRPGLPLMVITDRLERKLEQLIVKDGIVRGQAFPTGCSINHVAAHYTPNTGDAAVLQPDDVLKLDFGTHINGRIIDSAWTVAFNPRYDPLLAAVRDATNTGVRAAGVDARLSEIGALIQEAMESYEIELDGRTYRVRSIRNLNGHTILPYQIHGGKSVPIVKGTEGAVRMEEGEVYAIETFGSTGRAVVVEDGECSHYAMVAGAETMPLRSDKAKALLRHIDRTFGTLPFARKWLDRSGQERHLLNLNQLVDAGAVSKYPPLVDVRGSYTAQFEHTLILKPTAKEVLSRGEDY